MTLEAGQTVDMMTLATSKSNRFSIRYALLLLGLVWYTTGSVLATNLIVTNEPPRFPRCLNGVPIASPYSPQPLSCEVPVIGEAACDSNFSLYMNPGISVVSQFDLSPSSCSATRPDVAILQSTSLLAMGVSALVVVPLADKLGRKFLISIGAWTFFLASILASFSPSFVSYMIATISASAGLTAMTVPVSVTAAELMPTGSRHYLALTQVLAFAIGGGMTAGLAYFLKYWRTLTLLSAVPIILFCSGLIWITGIHIESPKWLASRGRMEDAYEVWKRIAKCNKMDQRDLMSLDEFIKGELETSRTTILSTPEELDEELSIMSVQYLASPDSVAKACSSFPTSIWLGCLIWLWIAAGSVYSGMWHARYGPMIDQLFRSLAIAPAPARSLQAIPPAPGAVPAYMPAPPPAPVQPALVVQQIQTISHMPGAMLTQPAAMQGFNNLNQMIPGSLKEFVTDKVNVQDSVPPQNVQDNAVKLANLIDASDPREYIDSINSYLRDGGSYILDSAKLLPQKAQELYSNYEMDKMLEEMRHDFLIWDQDSTAIALQEFQEKSRVQMLFTAMTYIMDLPCALMIIYSSGRSWCGRRAAILAYCFASGAMILSADIFSLLENTTTVMPLSMAVTGRSMLSAVYHMLFIYTSECVPTSVRCGCIGLVLGISAICAGLLIPLSNIIDTKLKEGTMMAIGAVAILASIGSSTILPDTLGLPLCDTLEIQDVMHENLGYHETFFQRRLHRVFAFVYQRLCCFQICFRSTTRTRPYTNNSLEAKGRSWLKNKINNKSRKHLFQMMSPHNSSNQYRHEDMSTVESNC